MAIVKALLIGDVVGELGLSALAKGLGPLKAELGVDFVVVNGENAAGGFGLTAETLTRILDAGADVVTSGNHVWEKRDVWPTLDAEERVVRPANYPEGAPGRGFVVREKNGLRWAVVNLQGREEMTPIDCPFRAADTILAELSAQGASPAHLILVDFHAESTQEKEALAFHLDGRASAVVGTHTHVQTADARLLPSHTAYITDLGMTGAVDGVIGMDATICMERNRTQVPHRMECATGKVAIRGVVVAADAETGKAVSIAEFSRLVEGDQAG
jgi:metallophosphoesterase (TIGR00282 family)